MRLTIKDLKKVIQEEYDSLGVGEKNPNRFLHGEDPADSEGAMAKGKLLALCEMATELADLLQDEDQLPGWTQDHISVAHENIRQVYGYLAYKDSSEAQSGASQSVSRVSRR
jgi:hypothetical protein